MEHFLIASDNPALSELIEIFINESEPYIAGRTSCSLPAIEKCIAASEPGFILVDLEGMGEAGLLLFSELRRKHPLIQIIVLSNRSEPDLYIACFRKGINGILVRQSIFSELNRCIHTISQGEKYLPVNFISSVLDYVISTPHLDDHRAILLSNREKEHIAYIVNGLNSKEIALQMQISRKTADNYRTRILSKLNLNSIADLVKFAIRQQIVVL